MRVDRQTDKHTSIPAHRNTLLLTVLDDARSTDAERDEVYKIRRGTLVEDILNVRCYFENNNTGAEIET